MKLPPIMGHHSLPPTSMLRSPVVLLNPKKKSSSYIPWCTILNSLTRPAKCPSAPKWTVCTAYIVGSANELLLPAPISKTLVTPASSSAETNGYIPVNHLASSASLTATFACVNVDWSVWVYWTLFVSKLIICTSWNKSYITPKSWRVAVTVLWSVLLDMALVSVAFVATETFLKYGK